MKHLKFVLKSGFEENETYTEKDTWVQCDDESPEELAEKVFQQILDNIQELLGDEEGEDDD